MNDETCSDISSYENISLLENENYDQKYIELTSRLKNSFVNLVNRKY
jgi:hypothetical protein